MFKNLAFYRIDNCDRLNKDELEAALAQKRFQECGSQDFKSVGWAQVMPNEFVLAASGHWLIRLQVQERLLPAAVIRQEAEKRAVEIEQQQGFKPGRKQMKDLKEQVVQELLPKSHCKDSFISAWIDPRSGWLGVDTSSLNKADQFVEALRKAFEAIELRLVRTEMSPTTVMTDWLTGSAPEPFTVDRECELRLPTEERSVVKYVRHALDGEEIKGHLTQGKTPVSLAMTWDDKVSFVLTEKFGIKKLALLDKLTEQSGVNDADDAVSLLIASVFLFGETVSKMLADLVEGMGGELQRAA